MRGEKASDLDVLCTNEKQFSTLFTEKTEGAYCGHKETSSDNSFPQWEANYNKIKFTSNLFHIDVGTFQQFAWRINLGKILDFSFVV